MILPSATDRSIVVFKFWPSLAYPARLYAAFVLIAAGLTVQFATRSFLWGALLVAAGTLLTLVSGYDNRVDFGKFAPDAAWVPIERERLAELRRLDRRIRAWDRSSLDVTNPLGAVVFAFVALGLAAAAALSAGPARILILDAALLLLPHWVTGVRSVLRLPGLLVKIELIQGLLAELDREARPHRVRLLALLGGSETRIPSDVKFRVDPENKPDGFLGLHCQVVLNEVQGRSYPYFYVCLVARRGYGLGEVYGRYRVPGGLTKEFDRKEEVEVLIIRQTTTKTSGYHTNLPAAVSVFREGLTLAEEAVASRP